MEQAANMAEELLQQACQEIDHLDFQWATLYAVSPIYNKTNFHSALALALSAAINLTTPDAYGQITLSPVIQD